MIYAVIATKLGTGKIVALNIKENRDIEEDHDLTLVLHHHQAIGISNMTNNSEKKEEIEEDLLHLIVIVLQTLQDQKALPEGNFYINLVAMQRKRK